MIGCSGSADRLTTPALVVDRALLIGNMVALANLAKRSGLRLWPHAKTHKSSELALLQLNHGAEGISVASVHEAEVLAHAGIRNILITSPVIGTDKIRRLVRLTSLAERLNVVVDNLSNVTELAEASVSAGCSRRLGVLVDVDIGMGRTGVTEVHQVVPLARAISSFSPLEFRGLQGYSGIVQHIQAYSDRRRAYLGQLDLLGKCVQALREAGFQVEMVTGGGTGSLGLDIESGILTDHQAGSYIFMDLQYRNVEIFEGQDHQAFQNSLSVRGSVVSANATGRVTIDCGSKAIAIDGPIPEVKDPLSACSYEYYGDEHGRVSFDDQEVRLAGSTVELWPPHCDPTVNLHDHLHVVSGNVLCGIWRIDARGVL
ncbi:hypothetical protein UP10_41150 [Bradyrhizobium sp. LTSPM299]|nr:hypothetical protein UP10_41150 [Bradyrhizobium sp. LTSPM299]